MFVLLTIVVSGRHMEDSFESAQLTDDGHDHRNYRSEPQGVSLFS